MRGSDPSWQSSSSSWQSGHTSGQASRLAVPVNPSCQLSSAVAAGVAVANKEMAVWYKEKRRTQFDSSFHACGYQTIVA